MGENHKISFFYGVLIVFTFYFNPCFAQNNMLVAHDDLHQMPASFEKVTDKPNFYIQQGPYHLSEMQFFSDSSFVYYFVSNLRYNITFGRYTQFDNLITLRWDSAATVLLAADSSNYKKYFKFKFPTPFKIEDKIYLIKSNSLENLKVKFPSKKTELYFSSNDFLKTGFAVDSFFQIKYNPTGTKLVLQKYNQKDVLFPKDSIWGYKICPDGWKCDLYRIAPKGTNWYTSAAIQVVQIDALIIYTIGSDFLNVFFSKDLNSTIYHLNNSGITKAFKENGVLLKSILTEMDKIKNNYTAINEKTDCFKIIEIYKEVLKEQK